MAFILLLFRWRALSPLVSRLEAHSGSKILLCAPLRLVWLLRVLAESNRAPFDFGEAESELVSGLNIEYGAGWFASLFITEYASMIFMSFLRASFLRGLVGGFS